MKSDQQTDRDPLYHFSHLFLISQFTEINLGFFRVAKKIPRRADTNKMNTKRHSNTAVPFDTYYSLLSTTTTTATSSVKEQESEERPNKQIIAWSMIKGIIIVNNHGKPRLVKFYQSVESESIQQSIIRRLFQQVSSRPDNFCNYLEGTVPEWGENIKLIYRHYATLYFVFAVDEQESDLGILDLIQVFVEALDKCFENVCELDLIFHSDRVHYILDEIVMGGMVLETNIHAVLQSIKDQGTMHDNSMAVLKSDSKESVSNIQQRLGGESNRFSYNW